MTAAPDQIAHRLCVAPMMAWTDRHCRYFHRLLSPNARLYTEMVTADALRYGDHERLLAHDPAERPVALQVGGADPAGMAEAARLGATAGFDEININVGCPSDRVQNGRFGACLMAERERVAECVTAMRAAVSVPVTVKTRIGIDDQDDYAFLARFADAVHSAGCRTLIVHARKAWLSGVSPKANREVPPLRYDRVARLRDDFPNLAVILNGGVTNAAEAAELAEQFDGLMLGRAAYQQPYVLAEIEQHLFGTPLPGRERTVQRLRPYLAREHAAGTPVKRTTRHILGLYHGCHGGRRWRRLLSENAHRDDAGPGLLDEALDMVTPPEARRVA